MYWYVDFYLIFSFMILLIKVGNLPQLSLSPENESHKIKIKNLK